MESMNVQLQLQPQVNVNITLTIIPFGTLKVQESWSLVEKQPEPSAEQGMQPDEFLFPEGTPISEVIPSPEPMVVITH